MDALETELEANDLELQTMLKPAFENARLWSKAKRLCASIKTLIAENNQTSARVEEVCKVKTQMKKFIGKVNALRKWSDEIDFKLLEGSSRAAVLAACEMSLNGKLASVKAKLTSLQVDCVNMRWDS